MAGYRLVTGHVGFEFAQRFPCFPLIVTLLRDPIARAVSAHGHLRSMDPDPLIQEEYLREIHRAKEQDLLGYIEADPAAAADHVGNVQTWHLASGDIWRRGVAKLTAVDLARAKSNLRRCASVGLTERFAASLEVLCSTLSWEPFAEVPYANQSDREVSTSAFDSRTLAALAELTRLDAELYRSAAEELDRRRRSLAVKGRGRLVSASTRFTPETARGPIEFTFDRAIPGGGWYGRERFGDRWASWTGPGREAWLELPVPAGETVVLRFRVVHALSAHLLHGLEVTADGVLLKLTREAEASGHLFTAELPRRAGEVAMRGVRLQFRVPETLRPRDLDARNPDSRQLGVAIDYVALLPALPGKPSATDSSAEEGTS